MRRLPTLVRLSRAALERGDRLRSLVSRAVRPSSAGAARAFAAFAFKSDERQFALELLCARPQFWLFRSNQLAFCGDFVVVDMSCPRPALRRAFVVDLKRGARLREGRGVGMQLVCATRAIGELARSFAAVTLDAEVQLLTGDASELLRYFGRPRVC